METNLVPAARAAASVLACGLVLASPARADERHERHEFRREHYGNPHWVYDDRFHHNRYYPAAGYAVTVLPPGNIGITFRGGRVFFHAGVW